MEEMKKDVKRNLKIWYGIAALILSAVVIFAAAPYLFAPLGMWGSILGEGLFLVICIGIVALARADVREVFPLKTPGIVNSIGVVLMWIGVMLLEMALLCVIAVFFPEQFFEVQNGMQQQFLGNSLGLLIFAVAVMPAVCEEVLFRGVFLNSLEHCGWWNNRWISAVICGLIFGMFHGDWIRVIPTAIAGIVMSYLLLETGNMFYNCLFHFVNNFFSVLVAYFAEWMLSRLPQELDQASEMMASTEMPLFTVGLYVLLSAAAPACIYIGNYLLHNRVSGYRKKLFPSGRADIVITIIAVSAVLFFSGVILMIYGMIMLPEWTEEITGLAAIRCFLP